MTAAVQAENRAPDISSTPSFDKLAVHVRATLTIDSLSTS